MLTVKNVEGQNVELDKMPNDKILNGKKHLKDKMSNGTKRQIEIMSKGRKADWDNCQMVKNVESNKCRMRHNVKWLKMSKVSKYLKLLLFIEKNIGYYDKSAKI
jgi:hypothetical protein